MNGNLTPRYGIGGNQYMKNLGERSAFSNSYRNSVVKTTRKKKYKSVSISLVITGPTFIKSRTLLVKYLLGQVRFCVLSKSLHKTEHFVFFLTNSMG